MSHRPVPLLQTLEDDEEEEDVDADDRCNITDDGKAALLRLSKGDMRRALNVLQVSTYLLPSLPFSASATVPWVMLGHYFRYITETNTRSVELELTNRHVTQHMIKSTKLQYTHVLVIHNQKI